MSEESDRKIADWIMPKMRKLFSRESLKELLIFIILVSIAVYAYGEATLTYNQRNNAILYEKLQTACSGNPATIICKTGGKINYSSLSGNSSFNVSSS